jgi:signal transduction histidine kinase
VRRPCDLSNLLESAAKGARLLARGHDLSVEVVTVPMIHGCDLSLTRLALANLADNLVKHTPPGSAVAFRGGGDRHGFWLEVADNGPGMDAEAIKRVFEPGYRLDESVPGTGHGLALALALARQMIEIQGGTLTGKSQPGQGSRFRIWLPHHAWLSKLRRYP